ncbi:hypothetical protein BD410DRAFT_775281 [Rickenella mellea]|uniref:Nuclear pore complex protein n=1 Tax=Rickenella mellea TaxID=50990 RepID=A0A4Y7PS31_9AGAM|nr:hypothetical protein BD410DRAFT_775281 [Rickenella mellea]
MADSFFVSSAEVLAQFQSEDIDLDTVLDPETGFAPRLAKICRKALEELNDPRSEVRYAQDEIDLLRLESNTWDLLQAVLPARKTETPLPPTARELLSENPYTPTATLAQSIMAHSRLLSELVVVREWLHDCAPPPRAPEATTGYWKGTRLRLMQGMRTGNKKEVEALVKELDPDAVNRVDDGKGLAADDASYEKALAQALYSYIRAGRLDDAVELCRKTHRPWRAASIRGSLLFQWRALSHEPFEDESSMDAEFDTGWSGNKRRKIWKTSCTHAALNPLLSDPDRALYAALAPTPATSVVLRSACRTWEDHLWAALSVICEGKQADELGRVGGGFFERDGGSIGGGDGIGARVGEVVEMELSTEEEEREEREWEREAVGSLELLAAVGVEEGPPANDPFHVSQLHIILNRTDKLLTDFADGLKLGEFNAQQVNYPTLTRFFAHLCLFLQMIDVPVPPDATQLILEEYLQVLENAGQRTHIAMYAAALGANAIERYALFLTSLELTADLDERRTALRRAEEHGLDMVSVARVTAERTVEKAFENLPRMKVALPSVLARETPLSDMEWLLIRSIEWTTFMDATYPQALEQANAIFRYFLAMGKVQAAKVLLLMLPAELKAIQDSREHSTEYYHYLQFFEIWDVLERIAESQATEGTYTTKGAKNTWLGGFKVLVDEAREKIVELLTTEWLAGDEEVAGGSNQRRQTLVRIRHIFIPELIIRLHALLVGTGDKIAGNLKKALELSNVVADSRYRLYDDFLGGESGRLNDYLSAVRQAILKGIEGGGSDPFRVLSV